KSLMKFLSLLTLMGILGACAISQEYVPTNHYIMDYNSNTEKPALKQTTPLPASLMINEAVIPYTYNRNQIVVKYSLNRVSYLPNDQWAAKLYETVTNLVQQRIENYNIFTRVDQDFGSDHPTYEMDIIVKNIERVDYGNLPKAHVAVDFNLRKGGNQNIIFTHHADEEEDLWDETLDSFVIAVNEMLMKETDVFSDMMVSYIKSGNPLQDNVISHKTVPDSLAQYMTMITGETEGEVYLPSLTDPDTEPFFTVYDEDDNVIASGMMGQPISIPNGNYTIRYGSDSRMSRDVTINANTRLTVVPDWGAMIVNIIDQNRNPVKIRYEVFNDIINNVVSFGNDYSRIEELGEKPVSWLLPPGQYKVTLNGQSYNTYTDFTTVNIVPNQVYRLSIVVDANNHMVGAGVIRAEDVLATAKGLKFSNSINGILNFTSNNTNEKKQTQSVALSGQFDNRATYDVYPHHYTTKSLYEMELTKLPGKKLNANSFQVTIDEYSIKNTYIYYFIKPLGIYTRADGASHFFPGYLNFDSPRNVLKVNKSGALVDSLYGTDKISISPSIFPLNLREGLGINYRIVQSLRANMNLRGGLGWQQEFNNDVFSYDKPVTDSSLGYAVYYDRYKERSSTYAKGMESSLISTFVIPFLSMGITSTADFLFPFEKGKSTTMDIENIVTISLLRNVSMDIRLDFHYDKTKQNYLIQDYRSYLRVSWFY
ncbi:MAG TPA: ABC-type transport auxiliary lipoprotein family protein, partial [Candidatus Cloacimonadota bacterium]|nr:ABC-type transport auxiliary lipoprotein family protein [Candidatus Cloacimonadota bacterium]